MDCHRKMRKTLISAMLLLISVMLFHPETTMAESTEEHIMYYLVENTGMTPAAACGVLANMDCESRFNPEAVSPTRAYGLCQWTNPRYSRMVSHCAANGLAYNSVDGQLSFIVYELQEYFPNVLAQMTSLGNDASAAYSAGYIWCLNYEGSGSSSLSSYRGGIASGTYWPAYGANAFYLSASEGSSGVKLEWAGGGASKYVIKRSTKPKSGFKKIATVKGKSHSYTDHSAKYGKKYYYKVSAVNRKGKVTRTTNKVSISPMRSLKEAKISLSRNSYTYNGKERKPAVKVTYHGKKLKKNKDYTVEYKSNVNSGTGKVVIRGVGKFAGKVTRSFAIKKIVRKIRVKNISVTWSKKLKSVNPGIKVSGGTKKGMKVTLSGSRTASFKKGKVVFKGCGVARGTVRLPGSKNYKAVSKEFSVTVRPQAQKLTSAVVSGKGAVTVKWAADKKADGYQIACSTNGKIDADTRYLTVKKSSVNTAKIADLQENSAVWICVRSFAGTGKNTAFGKWSKMIKVTLP